ncbi:hypothetical protein NN561_018183 [Cricetulus griseus]
MRGKPRRAAQAARRRRRGRGRELGARSMRGRACACHALLLLPALRPQRPSFFLRAPGVAAAGVPPGAWQRGRCWAQCISARQTRVRAPCLVRLESFGGGCGRAVPSAMRGGRGGPGSRPRSVHTTLVRL